MVTEDQISWLESFFSLCETNDAKLSTWERGFIADQKERYEKYGSELKLSPKQWGILNRVDAKLNGEST